jgi:hypothetical protein
MTLRQMQTAPPWPIGLIPICEWGCGIASYLDCSRPEVPVVRLDPNMAQKNVVACQGGAHGVGGTLPEMGAALDVGE